MFMPRRKRNQQTHKKAAEYATRSDFQEIFTEDMAGLHLLAFLLTADAKKAEQCFVAGLEESIRGNAVFRQWARSWSKRAIIKNAIKAMAPAPGRGESEIRSAHAPQGNALVASVMRLAPFDRFVLVITVLEGYSVRECSALLGQPVAAVAAAKAHTLKEMGSLPATVQADRGDGAISWASFLAPTQLA
jgi:hypothetical protein